FLKQNIGGEADKKESSSATGTASKTQTRKTTGQ
ncbi:lipoprotein LipL31, partial [Leptospira interrogans serovar Pomona]|nr:lipoprotein LipL31 [Leptospira interrogans serovar Pomona]